MKHDDILRWAQAGAVQNDPGFFKLIPPDVNSQIYELAQQTLRAASKIAALQTAQPGSQVRCACTGRVERARDHAQLVLNGLKVCGKKSVVRFAQGNPGLKQKDALLTDLAVSLDAVMTLHGDKLGELQGQCRALLLAAQGTWQWMRDPQLIAIEADLRLLVQRLDSQIYELTATDPRSVMLVTLQFERTEIKLWITHVVKGVPFNKQALIAEVTAAVQRLKELAQRQNTELPRAFHAQDFPFTKKALASVLDEQKHVDNDTNDTADSPIACAPQPA